MKSNKKAYSIQSFLIGTCLFLSQTLISQENPPEFYEQVIPPSPTVAALGKFGDIPVSLYTGTPSISIPFYSLKSRTLELPISLNYHASGMKVNEIASWVGIGWSLSAGGTIGRTVIGKADEVNGYLNFCSQLPHPDDLDFYSWRPSHSQIVNIVMGNTDSHPDIFNYSFSGRSGKFILFREDTETKAYGIPHNDLKIIPDLGNDRFTIIDESGTKYIFGKSISGSNRIVTETTTSVNSCGEGTELQQTSAWHLVEIISPGNTDIIELFYSAARPVTYDYAINETRYDAYSLGAPSLHGQLCKTDITTNARKIEYIKSANHKVKFTQAFGRDDLVDGSLKGSKLEQIQIEDLDGRVLKNYTFSYGYFTSGTEKRLKLETIIEGDEQSNTTIKPPYKFIYNEQNIPPRDSYDQDHWGFYNKAGNDGTLVPKEDLRGELLSGADREPSDNPEVMKGGILEKIIYPTGGYTEFVYEPHTYSKIRQSSVSSLREEIETSLSYIKEGSEDITANKPIHIDFSQHVDIEFTSSSTVAEEPSTAIFELFNIDNPEQPIVTLSPYGTKRISLVPGTYTMVITNMDTENCEAEIFYSYYGDYLSGKTAGGLRIRRITSVSGTNDKPIIKEYDYNSDENISNGRLVSGLPVYSYMVYKQNVEGGSIGEFPMENDPHIYLARSSVNQAQNATVQGSHICYSMVTEKLGVNAENGKTQYFYNYFSDIETRVFPFPPPTSNDWKRGLLESTIVFNSNNDTIKKVTNNYTFNDNPGNPNLHKIPGIQAAVKLDGYYDINDEIAWEPYYLVSSWYYLNKQEETNYDKFGNKTTNIKEYLYENPAHCQPTQIITRDSKNGIIQKKIKYPLDYTIGTITDIQTDIIQKIRNNYHIVNTPVETEVIKDGKHISASLTHFYKKGVNTVFLPGVIKKLNISQGITDFAPSYISTSGNFISDPRYTPEVTLDYSSNGNLLQYSKANNNKISYLWGYNDTYPIAKVINAEAKDVFHTSFEDLAANFSSEAKTGKRSSTNGLLEPLTDLTAGDYILSYWKYENGVWAENILQISATTSYTISLVGQIDEVRFYPANAQMITYTYDPLYGITSITNERNETAIFKYDNIGRLAQRLDEDESIIEEYNYYYGEARVFNVAPSSLSFGYMAETKSISIVSNAPWTINKPAEATWLSISDISGTGNQTVSISVLDNGTTPNNTTITISDGITDYNIDITQEDGPYLNVSPLFFENISNGANTLNFDVLTNTSGFYIDEITDNYNLISSYSINGNTITISCAANPLTIARMAIFKVISDDFSEIYKEISISQIGAEPPTHTVSGQVIDAVGRPLNGVTLECIGGIPSSYTTGTDGNYSFTTNSNEIEITPIASSEGEIFTPNSLITIVNDDRIQDFQSNLGDPLDISVTSTRITLSATYGDTETFVVSCSDCNNGWSATEQGNFYSISPSSGNFPATITVTATNNNTSSYECLSDESLNIIPDGVTEGIVITVSQVNGLRGECPTGCKWSCSQVKCVPISGQGECEQ